MRQTDIAESSAIYCEDIYTNGGSVYGKVFVVGNIQRLQGVIDKTTAFYSDVTCEGSLRAVRAGLYYATIMKAGLSEFVFSKQILNMVDKNKRFCKWIMKNREEINASHLYVSTLLTAFKKNKSLKETQACLEAKKRICRDKDFKPIREILHGQYEEYFKYIGTQQISNRLYLD